MPILDGTLQLASALALPTAAQYALATPYMSGTWLDTVAAQDWGQGGGGEGICWYVRIAATVTAAATSTLQFGLFGGSTSAKVTTGGTPDAAIAIAPVAAILQANMATQAVAGTEFKIKLPRGFAYRYINLGVVITAANLSAGAVDSWIMNNGFQDNKAYAAGYAV